MKNVTITINGNIATISSPYNTDIVKEMRRSYRTSTWDPKEKTWTIIMDEKGAHNESLIDYFERLGSTVIRIDGI